MGLLDDGQEYLRRSGRNLTGLLEWLGGGAVAGAEPIMGLLRGDALDEPFLPTADSGGRIGAIASAVTNHAIPGPMPSGALGTYGGIRSKTADKVALAKAQRMEKAGESAAPDGRIRQHTGWFKDPAGDWQYEISDADATVTPHPTDPNMYVMDHPKLEAAYPGLTTIPIHKLADDFDLKGWYQPGPKPGGKGAYAGLRGGMTPEELRSVGLHEIGGHAVQDRENFAFGAVPWRPDPQEIARLETRLRELEKKAAFEDWSRADEMDYEKAQARLSQIRSDAKTAYKTYRNHLGEFAARDIQARADYPDWKRQAVPPYSSEKIPPDDLIIKRLSDYAGGDADPSLSTDPPVIPIAPPLDMSPEARAARAAVQGFDTDRTLYHGTWNSGDDNPLGYESLQPSHAGGVWLTEKPEYAEAFTFGQGEIYPVRAPHDREFMPVGEFDIEAPAEDLIIKAMNNGYKGLVGPKDTQDGGQYFVFEPRHIRSIFAKYDPTRTNDPDLLASRVPLSGLLSQPLTVDDLKDRL